MAIEPNQIGELADATASAALAQTTADGAVTNAAAAQATANAALAASSGAGQTPLFPFLSSALTPASGWRLSDDGLYLEAGGDIRLDISSDVNNATPTGWNGIENSSNLASGPSLKAATDRLQMQHAATTATLNTTGPAVYREVEFQPGMSIAAFIGCDDMDEIDQQVYLLVWRASSLAVYGRVGLRRKTGPVTRLESRGSGSNSTPTFSDEQVAAGIWVRIDMPTINTFVSRYNTTDDADANPWRITWTKAAKLGINSPPLMSTSDTVLRVGLMMESGNSGSLGAWTGFLKALAIKYPTPWEGEWGAQKKSTSATLQLSQESDLGATDAVLSDAVARAYAAAIGNQRMQDVATLEWRFTRGTTGLSGSGSWYAASAIEVQGSGRYLLVEVRYTSSDGVKTASVLLNTPLIPGT